MVREQGDTSPNARGIKGEVLERKMRPFGLRRMQETKYPKSTLSLAKSHVTLSLLTRTRWGVRGIDGRWRREKDRIGGLDIDEYRSMNG